MVNVYINDINKASMYFSLLRVFMRGRTITVFVMMIPSIIVLIYLPFPHHVLK